ncbi:MAG TPA: cell division protein FtsZ [Bacteroidetes bacterium]|nr:cell division protein FtsZ [Bacteroidota bacterium]
MNQSNKPKKSGEAGKADMKPQVRLIKSDIDKELQKLLESHKTVIKVFGAGGAGNNTITRLMQMDLDEIETYAVNTDAQDLLFSQAHEKVLIGRTITSGLGAGSDPKIGEESARENQEELKELVTNADLVFVTCGLGGGTGTGSAPVIAETARGAGALTISIVTLPFSEEGVLRWSNAQLGLDKLRKNSDTLIVIQNDKLWEIAPEVPLEDAFKVADEILVNAVRGITELVTQKGLVNLDFADIRTIMKDGGTALIGMAESDSPDRSVEAVEKAIENPLIDLDISGAKNALLNITGGKDMSIKDAKIAMQTLAKKLDKSARIIWGSRINPELDKKVRVMVIATGLRDHVTDKLFSRGTLELKRRKTVQKTNDMVNGIQTKVEGTEESVVEKTDGEKNSKGEAKRIFREIMEEEADADLKIFEDTVEELEKEIGNKANWEELQKACSAITGTAQMFDFHKIAGLMGIVDEMFVHVLEKDFFMPEILQVLKDIPVKIRQMINGEPEANEWGKSFKNKIEKLSDYFANHTILSADSFRKEFQHIWQNNPSPAKNQEPEIETSHTENADPDNKVKTGTKDKKEKDEKKDDKSRFSSVNDVVKYVDKLLRN